MDAPPVPTLAADPWQPTPRFLDVDPWQPSSLTPASLTTSSLTAGVTDPLISSALQVVLRAGPDGGAG